MYEIEMINTEIDIEKYIEDYVNIDEFLEGCKECINYGKKWSCPPYDFNVLEYWKQFNKILIIGNKITFNEDLIKKEYDAEKLKKIMYETLSIENNNMAKKLYELEKKFEGSVSLSAGSCTLCGNGMMDNNNCTRIYCKEGSAKENCLHFDKMRYSLESLGANVGKTCSKLLGVKLEWVEENKLPTYYVLVSALLKK